MAALTATALAAQHGVTSRTARRWLAADRRNGYGVETTVVVVVGNGARLKVRAIVVPDEVAV